MKTRAQEKVIQAEAIKELKKAIVTVNLELFNKYIDEIERNPKREAIRDELLLLLIGKLGHALTHNADQYANCILIFKRLSFIGESVKDGVIKVKHPHVLGNLMDADVEFLTQFVDFDADIFLAFHDNRQLRLLRLYVEGSDGKQGMMPVGLCQILNYNPELLSRLSDEELQHALAASLQQQDHDLTVRILQQDFDFYAAIKLSYRMSEEYDEFDVRLPEKTSTLLLNKMGNIFKRKDAFELLVWCVDQNRFDAIHAMLKEVDKEKALKMIEDQLKRAMLDNVYHVPQLDMNVYQRLKEHGFLSKELVTSMENFYHRLAEIPKVDWRSDVAKTSDDMTVKMMSTLAQNPLLSKSLGPKLTSLGSINFWDGGKSSDNWSDMLKDIISMAPVPDEKHGEPCINVEPDCGVFSKVVSVPELTKGYKFLRTQGRTILFENEHKDILALKFLKQAENIAELNREASAAREFQNKSAELKLQSYFPEPVTVTHVGGLWSWILTGIDIAISEREQENFTNLAHMIPTSETTIAYVYKVDHAHRHYFTYLHDTSLTDAEFAAANRTAVADLYKLFANGVVFHQLADIFHNKEQVDWRDDKGRYIVLANLISSYALESRHQKGGGSGRLTGWQQAVAYPNVRGTGLADFGDFAPLKDFFHDGEKAQRFFGAALRAYEENVGNHLMANIMAEYQFVLYLIIGYRACKLTKGMTDETAVKKIWQDAAMQILNNCAQAMAILTPQSEDNARLFLLSRVNVKRLGRQMQFWMRETEKGYEYLEHVKNNSIPVNIYGPKVKVRVDTSRFRAGTFNPTNKDGKEMGFAIDGEHADLGPVNGQEPVKEKDRLFAWMLTMIFTAYESHRRTVESLAAIKEDKGNLDDCLFDHLPKRQFHATMFSLKKKELSELKVTRQAKPRVIAAAVEARKHQREYAAAAIQETWRAHKFRRVMSEEADEKVAVDQPKNLSPKNR